MIRPATLGVGLGFRPELRDEMLRRAPSLDFVEIIAEMAFNEAYAEVIDGLRALVPITLHGVHLSLGSAEPLDAAYVARLQQAVRRFEPRWCGDHLAMTSIGGIEMPHLTPLALRSDLVPVVAAKARAVRAEIGVPFLIENIAYYFEVPGGDMTEAEFFSAVLEQSDCGMLLDLNNLHVNAINHGYDPYAYIGSLPLDRLVEVHIAGSAAEKALMIDTHGHPVGDEVWSLLAHVAARTHVPAVLLERDQNIPSMDELLAEVTHARAVIGAEVSP